MGFGTIQTASGEEDLLEHVAAVVSVVLIHLSVQRNIIQSVITSHRAVNPHCGPVEGKGSGSADCRRHRERPIVAVPGRPQDSC